MIRVTRDITIEEKDLDITFVRASGPGGQNVNKLSTAAQLRFDINRATLAPDVLTRLNTLAGQRHDQRRRDRDFTRNASAPRNRNRADAIDRLLELLREAAVRPKPRRATRPTLGSKVRRLEGKKRRGDVKAKRGSTRYDD